LAVQAQAPSDFTQLQTQLKGNDTVLVTTTDGDEKYRSSTKRITVAPVIDRNGSVGAKVAFKF
jgi:hypothetical protein